MAVSDTKKCQTLINIMGQQALAVRAAVATMKACRTAYLAAGVDPTGTPLEGNVTLVSNAINSLDAEIEAAVWDGMIAAIVPSHRNMALEV